MVDLVLFAVLLFQHGLGIWASRAIAAQRPGASLKLWTLIGLAIGSAAPLFAWSYAGWRSGQSGVQMMRRQRSS